MALPWLFASFLFVLTLTCIQIQPSVCHMVKGSVSCVDCAPLHDLSGIVISMKCENAKHSEVATEKDGSFKTELPSDTTTSNCLARILGGPKKLCGYKKNIISKIIKSHDAASYTISTPLSFYTSCPSKNKVGVPSPLLGFGSSKTIDIPLPPEWGLAPSSYYIPFIPFPIGIP